MTAASAFFGYFLPGMTLVLHIYMYLDFKPNRLSVLFGLLMIIGVPMTLVVLNGKDDAMVGKPLQSLLFFRLYAVVIYWRFVYAVSFKEMLFVGTLVASHLQVVCIAAYLVLFHILNRPTDFDTFLWGRGIYVAVTLPLLPLIHRQVRPRLRSLLEAVQGQSLVLMIVLLFGVYLLGHAAIGLFYYHPGSVASAEASILIGMFIVAFYYTLYSFVMGERAKQQLKNQVEASERLVKTYEFYDAELKDKEQAIRTLRHDFRHMLLHLEALMEQGDHAGVVEHLQSLAGCTVAKRPVPYCENMTVNTLTTYHFAQAEEKGIACAAKLFVPDKLAVPAAELAVIFGNALENSLRGAESMGDVGYISFTAMPAKDCLVFDIENNYRPGGYRQGSGVGLSSIKSLCEKNGGRAEITDEDGKFRLSIVLRLE